MITIGGVFILAVALAVAYLLNCISFETVQAIMLMALVVVTTAYAASVSKQTELSRRAIEAAQRSEMNAEKPIVEPEMVMGQDYPERKSIRFYNQGKGPALNLSGRALHRRDYGDVLASSDLMSIPVVGAERTQERTLTFSGSSNTFLYAPQDLQVEVEYSDVYGRKFRSTIYRGVLSFECLNVERLSNRLESV